MKSWSKPGRSRRRKACRNDSLVRGRRPPRQVVGCRQGPARRTALGARSPHGETPSRHLYGIGASGSVSRCGQPLSPHASASRCATAVPGREETMSTDAANPEVASPLDAAPRRCPRVLQRRSGPQDPCSRVRRTSRTARAATRAGDRSDALRARSPRAVHRHSRRAPRRKNAAPRATGRSGSAIG
jgi:hypothetical protein